VRLGVRPSARPTPTVWLLSWLLVALAGVLATGPVFGSLTVGSPRRDDESGRASALLDAASGTGARLVGVVVAPVADPLVRAEVTRAAGDLRATPGVAAVLDLPDGGAAPLGADDGSAQLVVVDLSRGLRGAPYERSLRAVSDRLHVVRGATVRVGGAPLLIRQANAAAARDLTRAELIAVPLALAVLLVVFGGLVAAVLPVLVALATVGGALVLLLGIARLTAVSTYTVNVVTMFALGLAVDYGLLVLTRFREERALGADISTAVARADATAGRTVAVSGLTVAAAMAGLLVFGDPTLTSLAVGAIAACLVAVLAGRTLLPALLLALGDRIRPGRLPARAGRFARIARAVARRPVLVAGGVAAGLVLCALPALHLTLRHPDYHVLPPRAQARQAAELLAARFPGRAGSPVTVVAEASPGDPRLARYVATLSRRPGVLRAVPRGGLPPGTAASDLLVAGPAQGPGAQAVVRALRASRPDLPRVSVTGDAALLLDHERLLAGRAPWAALVAVLATMVLVFGFTGGLVVAVKAVVVAALSLSAAVGVLVWGFQDGHLLGLLGAAPTGALQLELPIIVVVFAFGLSLDYEIFLLGRITEAWEGGADPVEAVAAGLQRTGRVITSAALLVVVVMAGFATGEVLLVAELGVGLAVAVVVDATVVRCLLVPAAMALLGRHNWWAPAPLCRWRARLAAGPVPGALGAAGRAQSTVRRVLR